MQTSFYALMASFLPFAISTSFTPGPNNLMVANSGARFGFARSVPLQMGVVLGFATMNLGVGLGMSGAMSAAPAAFGLLKLVAIAYFVYLAWRIATAESIKPGRVAPRPISFLQAVALQAVNPKAWIMALGAFTTYTSMALDLRLQVLLITVTFAVVGAASTSTWALFGQAIRRYLTTPRKRTAFNYTMAALLLASVAPIIVERL